MERDTMKTLVDTIAMAAISAGFAIAIYTMFQITQGDTPTVSNYALYYSMGITTGTAVATLRNLDSAI